MAGAGAGAGAGAVAGAGVGVGAGAVAGAGVGVGVNKLKQRRDELAEKYGAKACQTDGSKLVGNIMEIVSRESFDAAVAELRPEIEKLMEALELSREIHYSEKFNNHGCMATAKVTDICDEALTKFKAFMEEK